MLTPREDEPDDARPKRKPYARPARSYRVGALTYPDRKECGPTEIVHTSSCAAAGWTSSALT